MEYEKSVPVAGDAGRAMETVVAALTLFGFRVAGKREAEVELLGPGMYSSKQNPLVGASRVVVRAESGRLAIHAEFDAVRRLIRTVGLVILGMAVLFLVLFGFVLPVENPIVRFVVPVLPFAGWPFLLPWMRRHFAQRTARALDALAENAGTR